MIADTLYRLTERDRGQPWARTFHMQSELGNAAAQVQASITWPNDRMLVLQALTAELEPGAAQFPVNWTVRADAPLVTGFVRQCVVAASFTAAPLAANTILRESISDLDLVIPSTWRLLLTGTFNAGAAVNTARLNVSGLLLPQGTLLF